MKVARSWSPSVPIFTFRGRIQPLRSRLVVVVAAFAVAFALDVLTDRRSSQVWGGIAIAISLRATFPGVQRWALPVGAYVTCWLIANLLRAYADDGSLAVTSREAIPRLESTIFDDRLAATWLQQWSAAWSVLPWIDAAATLVHLSFFVVPHAIGAILLVRRRTMYWRYVLATAVVWTVGTVGFWLVPTNPPWLATTGTGAPRRVADAVLARAGMPDGGGSDPGFGFDANPVASMPSIHLAITALLVAIAAGSPGWRRAALVYAWAMAFALVYLGEHHVVDVAAGVPVAGFAWFIAQAVQDRRRPGWYRGHLPDRKRPRKVPWSVIPRPSSWRGAIATSRREEGTG